MPLSNYGFIIKAPGYTPDLHDTKLVSSQFSTRVVGVSDVAAAVTAAQKLVADGIQLIELCGCFTLPEAQILRDQIDHAVLVGFVSYSAAEEERLQELFQD
jgi:Family of unknown function (DUF6506)